ncbi:MAG: glycerol-3-phosphate 1-O-acyltransferase PlsY [Planctomycetes bacterium]|nr:glycerol-3-phosphate 1-O-acyltransferase PlsY [Planctomycetota bacterium]
MLIIILGAIVSYLLGAIPFGLLIGFMKGVDIRKAGSKNIGATNLGRVLGGIKWFLYAFVLDFAKGVAAPLLFSLVVKEIVTPSTETLAYLIENPEYCMVVYSLFAILGHIFPLYLKFKGGKGVATGAGIIVVLAPMAFSICMLAFVLVFALTRMVSIGSIIASYVLVIGQIALNFENAFDAQLPITLFCIIAMLLINLRHRTNIINILNGSEVKVNLRKMKPEVTEQKVSEHPKSQDKVEDESE